MGTQDVDSSGTRKEMRLFVWTGFCPDWTDGLAFAIAETCEQAMAMITDKLGYGIVTWGTLEVHSMSVPVAYAVHGGG